ncbi:MAG TPA: hypothetical protein VHV28_10305 [Solirubrobacteraceae bacterium]|jgi:hypothetical protein|nr:hypothetical protein [Solirubrobacteraceae bacterium]
MNAESLDGYEALAALIERELQLVSERNFDELEALEEVRTALQSTLPATPPEEARATLERCRQLQKRVEIELLRVREVLLLDLGRVRHAQRAADGYAPVRRREPMVAATA